MEKYEHIQKTTALRNQNGVKAYKILDIREKHLVFQLWLNSDEQEQIQVSMPEEYKIGEYIDLIVSRAGRTSYSIKLIGRTPQKFIPADGRNIAI